MSGSSGIVFSVEGGAPKILRIVQGQKETFPMHIEPGECLLITDEELTISSESGIVVPDLEKVTSVLHAAIENQQKKSIIWL
ncbi:MAG: hypothetical protein E5X98_14465 [Mesorhizobium sp.]|nr:MAG: hypothetical protein EOR22_06605 [Mesorhizobium sp.]TIO71797.1 MAG: hypothetical protein E5X98_14465 [Mesorhizobium sp.]